MPWIRRFRLGHWPVTLVDIAATTRKLADGCRCATVLAPREAETYHALRSDKRRREWLAGRFAAKLALRHWCRTRGVTPPSFELLTILSHDGPIGGPPVSPIGGTISISHSHGLAAAVACPTAVGIDIERLRPFSATVRTLFLGEAERDWLALAEVDRPQLATIGWSFKEAFSKARGQGILDGQPSPELRGWSDGGQLLWRWPGGTPFTEDLPRPDTWDAYGRVIDGYAIAVVGARSVNADEEAA